MFSVLRVYRKFRKFSTVPQILKLYSLYNEKQHCFDMPVKENIESRQVIVTTLSTSYLLHKANAKGLFTHILIDEAGQAMESQTAMPLTLADKNTCVVIAGDHHQMSPVVHSEIACQRKFNQSLLERLLLLYQESNVNKTQNLPYILLQKNFRCHPEILEFVGDMFYGGCQNLFACSGEKISPDIQALTFYESQGPEERIDNGLGYFNKEEASIVAEQLEQLLKHDWPHEWGLLEPKDIGVVAPYHEQVLKPFFIISDFALLYQAEYIVISSDCPCVSPIL